MLNMNSDALRSHNQPGRPVCSPGDQSTMTPATPSAPPTSSSPDQTPQDTYVPAPRESEEQSASSNFSQMLGSFERNFPAPNEAEDRNGNSSPSGISMLSGPGASSPYDTNPTEPIPIGGGGYSATAPGGGPAVPGQVSIIRLPGY